jgi:cytochrome c
MLDEQVGVHANIEAVLSRATWGSCNRLHHPYSVTARSLHPCSNHLTGEPLKSVVILAIALIAADASRAENAVDATEELMEKSGCISCHRIDEKLIGPSFKQIAAKYRLNEQTISYLLTSVRNGSEGVWGDVPMPPNSEQKVSDADLRRIVEWVLQR